ncbi:VOC family protein [Nonomuraea rhizosphaerae]|uniref:VOC family protein n=1 Tax=Nonomuraea rhizosphaerae TaxID=2665663 RepID=UPI001C5F60F8|nr:VOC family protein [Nonomuraea rhizosphaerae]
MIGKLQCVVLDCPDVLELARFYHALLGGTVNKPDRRWAVNDDFATLHAGSGLVLAFQRVKDYRAPRWPDGAHPQQFHLDIDVPDLEPAQDQVLDLGARLLHVDRGGWRVFADPAGHPFCLIRG